MHLGQRFPAKPITTSNGTKNIFQWDKDSQGMKIVKGRIRVIGEAASDPPERLEHASHTGQLKSFGRKFLNSSRSNHKQTGLTSLTYHIVLVWKLNTHKLWTYDVALKQMS